VNMTASDSVRAPDSNLATGSCDVSVLVPVYNEEKNIVPLTERLFAVLDKLGLSFEIVAVDDGSIDGSLQELKQVAERRRELKIISFSRNSGQTAALMAGFDYSSGKVAVSIDADLQNDPDDIPILLAKIDEGYDVVAGWRTDRKDAAVRRNFPSHVANRLISLVTGVHLHDFGCTLKAYRREVMIGVRLYGEMHRFIPVYASWQGAKVTEISVRHYERRFGKSNYGLERIAKVILDLMVVKFLDRHLVKPIYVFGGFGLLSLLASMGFWTYALYLKYFEAISFIQTPLPLATAMFFLVGILSLLMGLVAEMLARTYFESQDRRPYAVRATVNIDRKSRCAE
jgi:glycosyltransferase involved in cell wall biosynthesis